MCPALRRSAAVDLLMAPWDFNEALRSGIAATLQEEHHAAASL